MFIFSKHISRKGQFTIFVILALVILFSFAFVMYAKNQMVTQHMIDQADREIKEYIDKNSIDQYVTSCLDAVAKEVVMTTMIQGGKINFTSPTEYVVFNDTLYNRTVNVSIAIRTNYNCPDNRPEENYLVYNGMPIGYGSFDYPYRCGPVKVADLESKFYNPMVNYGNSPCKNSCTGYDFSQYSGFFGINNMTRLCNSNGTNKMGVVTGTNYLTCDYYNNFNKSLQQEIEREIERQIVDCINFTDVRLRSAGNTNITRIGDAKAVITFIPGGYNIKLVYPFTILLSNRKPITRMVNFGVDNNIPLKEIYEYTYELFNYDVKYAEFNIVKDYNNVLSKGFRRLNQNIRIFNYSVDVIKGDISNDYTDIARITDNDHEINGIPLMMYIGINNRQPVLDFLHYTEGTLYDVTSSGSEIIVLSPQGYDPDDDNLTYIYGGWNEDYSEKYTPDMIGCDCGDTPNIECITEYCMEVTNDNPQNWSLSSDYLTTHQNASYKPGPDDIGIHIVTIKIMDEHGLIDIQYVRILIFDMPQAIINIGQAYDDTPFGFASYEDLFSLDASESKGGIYPTATNTIGEFKWEMAGQTPGDPIGFTIIEDLDDPGADSILNLSEDDMEQGMPITMENIVNYAFRKPDTPTEMPIPHNIKLTITTLEDATGSATEQVTIVDCLAHRSSEAIYPYNNEPYDLDDSLHANHTCCTDSNTYAPSGTTCFSETIYGTRSALKNYQIGLLGVPFSEINTYNPGGANIEYPIYNLMDNDIFREDFERKCSDDPGAQRGNVCGGEGSNNVYQTGECEDYNYGTSDGIIGVDFERCSGPPPEYIGAYIQELYYKGPKYSTTPISCVNYTGSTFEKLLYDVVEAEVWDNTELPIPTGYCDPDGACNMYNQYCQGQCDGTGGCDTTSGCTCDHTKGCSTTTDEECDGDLEYPDEETCNIGNSGVGDLFIGKRCDSCGLVNDMNICRSASWGTGCTADEDCNGHQQESYYDTGSGYDNHRGCTYTCEYIDCGIEIFDPYTGTCSVDGGGGAVW